MGLLTRTDPWTEHRRRATALGTAGPHAAEVLRLYLALLDVWSESAGPIRAAPPAAAELPAFAVRTLLPGVLGATLAAGPLALRESVLRRFEEADLAELVARWLAGAELPAVDRYLARAAAAPILELVPDLARATGSTGSDSRHCPACLVTIDLPKDPAAEPVVDELAALPLDLFARERGFTKITPNLVGF